ncbi:MAG: CoA-transferase family [Bradyrhizobium sp.]|nr:CoA-transferase family [Bradyrhizobium sp.]
MPTSHPIAQSLLTTVWSALGGGGELLDRLSFHGEGTLRSPFAVTDLAAASFGSAALAISELLGASGGDQPAVAVDRVMSSGWFDLDPIGPSRPLAGTVQRHVSTWMAEFETADQRWVRLQASFPTLRARIARTLGTREDLQEFASEIRKHRADDIESLLVEAGAAVAASRSAADWLAHPQGKAVSAEPIAAIEPGGVTDDAWKPTPGRPLAGIRVLDLTRVVSGPMATRFLAACGAEVLRLDAPGSDESSGAIGGGNDLGLGKRWALLNLKTAAGQGQFLKLLSRTDILVHGYRPGAIDGLGITDAMRRSARPGLVEIVLNAYGWTGPWSGRRGFDTLVQFSTGLANETTAWALADPDRRVPINALGKIVDASRPRHLPVEALDLGTGYMLAAAAIRGLTRRLTQGIGSTTRMSLARTAHLLLDAGHVAQESEIRLPLQGPLGDRIYSSAKGPVRHLKFPVTIEGNPLFWERPAEAAGASVPRWSTETR